MAKHHDLEKRLKKELYLLAILFIVALATIAVMLTEDTSEEELTAWATVKSNELHGFMKDCRSSGGVMDVRPNAAPHIVFMCMFLNENPQRTIEYTLSPGNRRK